MEGLLSSLVQTSKQAQSIAQEDLSFYRASDAMNSTRFDALTEELLELSNLLLSYAADTDLNHNDTFMHLTLDQFTDNYADVTEITDNLLDNSNILIDTSLGRNKRTRELNAQPVSNADYEYEAPKTTMRKANILKPQQRFASKIDNSNTLFVHTMTIKPNARVALMDSIVGEEMQAHMLAIGQSAKPVHPYQYEIENIEYPDHVLCVAPEVESGDLESRPCTWVDTEAGFTLLLAHLATVTEIAVDLEHHDYRTFQGLVCLIQLSTRTRNYLIDPFPLRASLHLLNHTFTNPAIIKVFHGAESDITWLQRDFGVYVVCMFDTYHASHLLEMPHHGLGYLLLELVGVATDKKFQMADWRIRPLSDEMTRYAKTDTHYLLEIYDKMRNCLIENESTEPLLRTTLDRSARTSLKLHQKEIYQESGLGAQGFLQTLQKSLRPLTSSQFEIYKTLHALRDQIARSHDESLRCVMPNHVLFNLAIRAPNDEAGVLGACSPPTQLVRTYTGKILEGVEFAVTKAREMEATASKEREVLNLRMPASAHGDLAGAGKHVRFEGVGISPMDEVVDAMRVEMSPFVEESKKRKVCNVVEVTVKQSSMFASNSESEDEASLAASKLSVEIRRTLCLLAPQMIPQPVVAPVATPTPTLPVKKEVFILSQRVHQKADSNDPLDLDAWMRNESKVSAVPPTIKHVTPHNFEDQEEEMNAMFMRKSNDKDARDGRTTFNPFVDGVETGGKKKKEKLKKLPKLTNKPRSGNKTSTM